MMDEECPVSLSLPDEVLDYVLSLVSPYADLLACSLVSKRWNHSVQRVKSQTVSSHVFAR